MEGLHDWREAQFGESGGSPDLQAQSERLALLLRRMSFWL